MSQKAIIVSEVTKYFKLPHERHSSVKSLFVNLFRGRRTYERQRVLDNVSFTINNGDFFGIVGRNGSGKSTLLKMLAGIYSPNKGAIIVNGKLTPFIELGVGFNPELSGRENIYLNGALLGFSKKEMDIMYDDIVDFAELQSFMDQKLRNYSSGMQVRLAFSIAIRARTDILLLDEVLAVGDAAFQQKCYNYFEQLKRERKTVVFVSHDMGAVRRFCNRAVYIKDGSLIFEGSPSDVADIYMENNIDSSSHDDNSLENLPEDFKVSTKILKQDEKTLEISISYVTPQEYTAYVGIAIVRDGVSIAEIITPPNKPLRGRGAVRYSLDKRMFNQGAYRIGGATLFKLENKELVAVSKSKISFTVKGDDITRGGALKLPDSWDYGKN